MWNPRTPPLLFWYRFASEKPLFATDNVEQAIEKLKKHFHQVDKVFCEDKQGFKIVIEVPNPF